MLTLSFMHQSIPPAPRPPWADPWELAFFSHGWQIPGGGSTSAVKCPAVGTKVEGECPAPGIVLMSVFIFVRCNRSQSCSSKEMKRIVAQFTFSEIRRSQNELNELAAVLNR